MYEEDTVQQIKGIWFIFGLLTGVFVKSLADTVNSSDESCRPHTTYEAYILENAEKTQQVNLCCRIKGR